MLKDAQRISCFGRSGSGKSTLVKNAIKAEKRIVIFDPLDEYREIRSFRAVHTLNDVLKAIQKGWKKGFKIAYVPPAGREKDALHRLSKLLLQVQKPYKANSMGAKKLTLVVEEMNLSFPVTGLQEKFSGFPEICSRGRHSGINVYGISQRMAEVNTRFRGNCNKTFIFPLQDNSDIDAACKMLGRVYRHRIQNLENHHYFCVEAGKVRLGKNKLSKN